MAGGAVSRGPCRSSLSFLFSFLLRPNRPFPSLYFHCGVRFSGHLDLCQQKLGDAISSCGNRFMQDFTIGSRALGEGIMEICRQRKCIEPFQIEEFDFGIFFFNGQNIPSKLILIDLVATSHLISVHLITSHHSMQQSIEEPPLQLQQQ